MQLSGCASFFQIKIKIGGIMGLEAAGWDFEVTSGNLNQKKSAERPQTKKS
jgi:hypothetical protein